MAGPMSRPPQRWFAALALAVVAGAGVPAVPAADLSAAAPRLGFLVDAERVDELPPIEGPASTRPVARLEARWETIEAVPGTFDWTRFLRALEALDRAGYAAVVALTGSHSYYLPAGGPASPLAGDSLRAWLDFVRSAARSLAGRADVFELGEAFSGRDEEADVRALVLKQSALALRAEAGARGAAVRIAQPGLPAGSLDWQRALWERDVAAYVDVLPLVLDAGGDLEEQRAAIRDLFQASLEHPPAAEIWVYVRGGEDWDAVDTAIAASSAGARVALHEQGERGLEAPRWTAAMGSVLADGYAPAPVRGLRLQAEGPTVGDPGRVLGRFFNERDFTSLVVYRTPAVVSAAELVVDATQVRDVRALDPLTGRRRRARSEAAADGRGRVIRVEAQDPPGVVVFRRPTARPGLGLETEEVDVERERGLTAEEIIARFQLLERDQEDRLERWTARGRIEFHFNLAQAVRNIDVSIDTQYFWERGGQLEWEQTAYYINGNKVRWKKFPELPIVQPEKVITLPLDLTLDRTYRYRLVGEDRVDGRMAYVIAFEPAAADAPESLYRGRVWIDKESFARRKASVVQTNLAPPVLSNEEIDRFAEVLGPDGGSYWMFSSIDGQQVWSTAGRSFVVRREVLFSVFEINPSKEVFDERRAQAYASDNRMLRETDQGFRYLDRESDGTRTVRLKDKRSQWFGALGALKDGRQ